MSSVVPSSHSLWASLIHSLVQSTHNRPIDTHRQNHTHTLHFSTPTVNPNLNTRRTWEKRGNWLFKEKNQSNSLRHKMNERVISPASIKIALYTPLPKDSLGRRKKKIFSPFLSHFRDEGRLHSFTQKYIHLFIHSVRWLAGWCILIPFSLSLFHILHFFVARNGFIRMSLYKNIHSDITIFPWGRLWDRDGQTSLCTFQWSRGSGGGWM